MTRNIVQDIFNAKECDVRLLSGLNGLTVLIFSLFENSDVMYKMYDMHGGHLSVKPIADRLKLDIVDMMLGNNYRFNLDNFEKNGKQNKQKQFLDSSYVLFPYPLKEIRSIVGDEVTIMYDASHMSALIAAKDVSESFDEGADIIHSTTHKINVGATEIDYSYEREQRIGRYNSPYGEKMYWFLIRICTIYLGYILL